MRDETPARPPFDYGSAQREAALVVLQAAVINRRVFLPAAEGELTPIHWQVLVAIALTNPLEHGFDPGETVRGLRSTLTVETDQLWETMAELKRRRLVRKERHAEDSPDDQVVWSLTAEGQAAAAEFIDRAARFLPGWPPAHR